VHCFWCIARPCQRSLAGLLRSRLLQAVGEDSRLRAFFPDDSLAAGLLLACQDANPQLESPLGALCGQPAAARGCLLRCSMRSTKPTGQLAAWVAFCHLMTHNCSLLDALLTALLHSELGADGHRTVRATMLPKRDGQGSPTSPSQQQQQGSQPGPGSDGTVTPDKRQVQAMLAQAKVGCQA
jgi:hypothetical protein